MTLSYQDQVRLIKDILTSHHGDSAATLSEYEQLFRSTNVVMTDDTAVHLGDTIRAINGYSETGMRMSHFDDHLNQNKGNMETWIQDLQ